jgi:hypothetical protein
VEPLKPCNTYAARPAGTAVYRLADSVFKVYYADIYGRAQPERYEWDLCGRNRDTVLVHLAAAPIEGVGVVVAFPHITKVFRFAPSAEIIMHVKGYWTEDFREVDLGREEGYVEFACYAEAIIAAEEYRLWAEAANVAEYLARWVQWTDAPIIDNAKLGRYFAERTD